MGIDKICPIVSPNMRYPRFASGVRMNSIHTRNIPYQMRKLVAIFPVNRSFFLRYQSIKNSTSHSRRPSRRVDGKYEIPFFTTARGHA